MKFNYSFELQQAIERAIYIAEDISSNDELATYQVLLSILMNEDCTLQRIFLETGTLVDYYTMLNDLNTNKEIFEKISKEKFVNKDYDTDAEDSKDEEVSENSKDEEIAENSKEDKKNNQSIYIFFNPSEYDNVSDSYGNIKYSSNLQAAFEDAFSRCQSNGRQYIDVDNLLFSIFNIEDCSANRLLIEYNFDINELKNILLSNSDIYTIANGNEIVIPPILESCCEILNNNYQSGEVCDILCRDKEISTVWNIFSKKNKRNAILVGEAGVGKTAIIEAITMQIVNGTCPKEFKKYNVISLNLNGMVAGTKYRGEFETKVDNLIKFLKNNKNIILFVDEIHQILGAGAAENSGPDLSGSLKPILARNDVVFVGATTEYEYKKYFEQDPAFKRRFEKVIICEPNLKDVKKMIELKVKNLSLYHNIQISDDVIDYAIITAKAMNYYGKNPDLTIDLIDRAMALGKIKGVKQLTKKDVVRVYQENYDTFKRISKKDRLSTAYHEAGHALLKMLARYNRREDLKIVSIIPTEAYLGVTISEPNKRFTPITRNAVLEEASMCIAGRVSQEFVDKNWDFGASQDLVQATGIIRDMIVEKGMDNNIYTNISLYDYNSNTHAMSPQAVDKVNERIEEIMKDVYNKTKQILLKNKDKLDIIVGLLMEKGIISMQEIKEALKK